MKLIKGSFPIMLVACCLALTACKPGPTASGQPSRADASEAESDSQQTKVTAIKTAKSPARKTGGVAGSGAGALGKAKDSATTEPTVTVYGKITTEDGAVAPDVLVEFHTIQMNRLGDNTFSYKDALSSSTTDGEGHYEVHAPKVSALMHLQIKGNVAPMQLHLDSQDLFSDSAPKPGHTRIRKDIKLLPSHKLTGVVVNETGQPMAGVPVHLKPKIDKQETRLFDTTETTTSASGTFDLNYIASGTWMIGTAHPDYAAVTEEITVPSSGSVTLRLGARGGTLSGHVYHKQTGAAVSGISVMLLPGTALGLEKLERFQMTSGADGSFQFERISSGTKRLYVPTDKEKKLGLAMPIPPPLQVAEGETTDVALFVYPGHAITGRVFDKDTDDPLSGAKVSMAGSRVNGAPEAVTDASGRFRIDGIYPTGGGQSRLTAELEGYRAEGTENFSPEILSVVLSDDSTEATKDVPMIKTILIKGIVVTKDEMPVPHAKVTAYDNRSFSRNTKSKQVNADGTFELEAMPFSTIVVEAEGAGFAPALSESQELTTKDVEGVKIVIQVGAVVQGRVLGPDGQPVEDAAISQSKSYTVFTTNKEVARSGAKGEYTVKDVPQSATFKAKKDGFAASEELELTLASGEVRTGADLSLQQAFEISGRVVDGDRKPVASASVSARGPGDNLRHEQSDKDGKFVFKEIVEGVYNVAASGNWERKEMPGVKAGTTGLEIILDRNAEESKDSIRFIGTVLDDVSGEPMKDFKVEPSSNVELKMLAEAGKFELVGVRRNYGYNVKISSPGYMEQKFETTSSQDGADITQTFRLGKGGGITGRVIERATGKPIPDMVVINWGTTQYYERSRISPPNHSSTDKDGRFLLAPAPTGRNTVQFKPTPPLSEVSRPVDVKSEETVDMGDIEMTNGGTIKGLVVRGADDEPVPSQSVSITMYSEDVQLNKKATTNAEGRFEFAGLPAGNYTARVESASKSVQLAAEGAAEVTLRLGGVTIKGTVTRAGAPVQASVRATGADGQIISGYAQSGEYTIKNAIPGKYEFSVDPQQGNSNGPIKETVDVPDQAEFVKNFELPDGRIEVTVTDAAGEPAQQATVNLSQKSSNTGFDQRWLTRTAGRQVTDVNGKAEFKGLGPGTFSVSATKEGAGTAMKSDVQVQDGQPAQVQLQLSSEGGTLVSMALSYATGQGVQEAWCYLHGENGPFTHSAKRDASGQMVIENIPPGTYTTNVSYWSHSQSERQVEIKANETVKIEDVLYAAGALHWRLKKADGTAAAGATMTVVPVTSDPPEETRSGMTGPDGLFVQRGLAGGTYQVTAQLGGKSVVETFVVVAGANEEKSTTVPGW